VFLNKLVTRSNALDFAIRLLRGTLIVSDRVDDMVVHIEVKLNMDFPWQSKRRFIVLLVVLSTFILYSQEFIRIFGR
jgi:hypothetical protein